MELPDSIKAISLQLDDGGEITPAPELFDAYEVFAAELAQIFTRPWLAVDHASRLAADGEIPADVLTILRARHDHRAGQLPTDASSRESVAAAAELRAELIAAEREYIYRLLQEGQITDEARRRIERELDLEEASLAFRRDGEADVPL